MAGAWTNANAFAPLVARSELKDHPVYKAATVASFATTSWGFTGLATIAARRALRRRADRLACR